MRKFTDAQHDCLCPLEGKKRKGGGNCPNTWKETANLESSPSALSPFYSHSYYVQVS